MNESSNSNSNSKDACNSDQEPIHLYNENVKHMVYHDRICDTIK